LNEGLRGVPSGSPSSPIAKEKRELEGDEVLNIFFPFQQEGARGWYPD